MSTKISTSITIGHPDNHKFVISSNDQGVNLSYDCDRGSRRVEGEVHIPIDCVDNLIAALQFTKTL